MGDINKRILWHSNAGHVGTGYGTPTRIFTPLVKKAMGEVIVSTFCGIELGYRRNGDGILELPRYQDPYGNDVIEAHYGAHKIDGLVTLIDPFVLNPDVFNKLNCAMWTPVDSTPISPENWRVVKTAPRVWSMAKFGHAELLAAGYPAERLDYVPIGIDTDVFRPVPKAEARARVGEFLGRDDLDTKYIVMTTAANKGSPSRKNFVGMLRAFKKFAENIPNAIFYIHTEPRGVVWGDNVLQLVADMGLSDRVIFPPTYDYAMGFINGEMLNDLYNMADVFLLLSYGEGFGIPIVEAQAAGLSVVLTRGSSMTELGEAGYLVDARRMPCTDGHLGCEWWYADEDDAVRGLNEAYSSWTEDAQRRDMARAFAVQYDYRRVFDEYMLPALKKLVGISDILPSDSPSPEFDEKAVAHVE